MAAWASPLHFRVNAGCRTGTKLRTELQRQDEQKWEWSVKRHTPRPGGNTVAKSASSDDKRPDKQKFDRTSPKNETASNTLSNDSRPVPPKGSVLLQHCGTKRSVEREDSLWDWLTTSTTTTAATRQLEQWCSIQHKSWMELQRLQRRIQRTHQIRDRSRQLPARTPTAVLEQLRDRIKATALDMTALNQSCNVERNTPRAHHGPPRPAVCRRAPTSVPQTQPKRRRRPRRKRRSDKRPSRSKVEESSSSADRVNSQKKGAWCCKEPSPPSSLIHFQITTSLHLHITTQYIGLPCGTSSPASTATANNEECRQLHLGERNSQGVPPFCAVWPSCRRSLGVHRWRFHATYGAEPRRSGAACRVCVNCAGSVARLASSVALSDHSSVADATTAEATLLSANFALGTPSRTDDSPGIRSQRPAVRQPVNNSIRTRSQYLQQMIWTTARFRTALPGTSV